MICLHFEQNFLFINSKHFKSVDSIALTLSHKLIAMNILLKKHCIKTAIE